ncbi:DUF58 domain-containing protein [Arenicella xantha]|uniref:Uncharacterized protein (DUF58 family) n=1 Tax=Arenicella xantha TaxID=644221 RepID=A0A395JG26_9GAMM|nr:DUF58 domain-containing protein [Arenicella xantha]RBP48307.1 uncharacterized protein (DUF58 family) [Arenicella xantha]
MRLPEFLSVRPSQRLLQVLAVAAVLGLCLGGLRVAAPESETVEFLVGLWWWLLAAFGAIAIWDALSPEASDQYRVRRVLPNSLSLNRSQTIAFEFENLSNRPLKVSLSDGIPEQLISSAFPLTQTVAVDQNGRYEYSVIAKRRGLAEFEPAFVLIESRLGFWEHLRRLGGSPSIKVYPDFTAVSNSFVFGVEQAMRNMGAHIAKRKGDGMEFNQLRDFREGDTLKQVDWKATAKLGSPISREYQEEKDQNIVFLLDCSRRMRAMENNLSYFDYALNALLMSSYIALDKGDAVGVMSFSGEPSWLPPIKGKTSINVLLNHLYALTTSTESSDYVTAAENLLLKQRKRSLIIVITNVRDEDSADLQKAVSILSRQHLVMIVALQERLLENADRMELSSRDDTLLYAGIKHFERNRKQMLALLKAQGVSVVDATHKNIHVQLVSEYLRLKQYGRI